MCSILTDGICRSATRPATLDRERRIRRERINTEKRSNGESQMNSSLFVLCCSAALVLVRSLRRLRYPVLNGGYGGNRSTQRNEVTEKARCTLPCSSSVALLLCVSPFPPSPPLPCSERRIRRERINTEKRSNGESQMNSCLFVLCCSAALCWSVPSVASVTLF
jgi:hypothetical protein